MQNALPRVGVIEREAARFGVSDTEFIRWPWWRLYVTPSLNVLLAFLACGGMLDVEQACDTNS